MKSYDVLVVGGGMAGVSIGYELSADRTVGLLEMEATLAFHTTGRSVATFLESYGGRTIRLLTTASREFLTTPPDSFDGSLLKALSLVWVAPNGEADKLLAMAAAVREFVAVTIISPDEVDELAPVFRPGWVELGIHEPGASEIDVAALHEIYASGIRRRGGAIHTGAGVTSMTRSAGRWRVTDRAGNVYDAAVVVNAAGAWADVVANMAGAQPVNIRPLRRTVFSFRPPPTVDIARLPLVSDVSDTFYFKPEAAQILASPADEVPSEPCDARPEEIDIARAIDIVNDATTFDIRHVGSSWAGLRSFVADRTPVVGFDDQIEGFFWFVGQGGYGIQIAPALSEAGAGLIRNGSLPDRLVARGLDEVALHRSRLAGIEGLAEH
jgi:D-arginine dehydrogenase